MSVLILGATSPIGRQLAYLYAQEGGEEVYVAARDGSEAEAIARDVELRFQKRALGGCFEATDFESHSALIQHVETELGPISVVLVVSGAMGIQVEAESDFKAAREIIDVNFTGAASLCEAVAKAMEGRRQGSIVGVSSVAGDRGRQSNYFYGSAKGAFSLYLQGLRNRLFGAGVHVLTVKLGFIDTPMTRGLETSIPIASPKSAARAIFEAQQRQQDVLYYPRFWGGVMGIVRGIPERIFKRLSL